MIIARDLRIEVGPRVLLDEAALTLNAGDKVGLVGRSGAGKTTLLKVLAGVRAPEDGRIGRSGTIGYLSQETALPALSGDLTTYERILTARAIGDIQREMETTRRAMEGATGDDRERLIRRFAGLEGRFEAAGGYHAEAEAKRVAAAVGLGRHELQQSVGTMSGGQRRRVELARVLFAETDVLLLDEPTNHLDLDAKAWLMEFLGSYRGGLLVVSHDLPLLDQSITSVLSVEDRRLEAYRGNHSFYLAERERRRLAKEKLRGHQEAKIARLEANIRRFKHTTEKMAKRARSWETRVDRIKQDLVSVERRGPRVGVHFPQPEPSGRTPVAAHGLAKAFADNVVFVDVDVDTNRSERMLIMGLNGAGKTTLLRILAGVESPDLGRVELGHRVSLGYYAQEHEQIRPGTTVFDHMRAVSPDPDSTLRGVLGHFLLADKIDQDAGTLSGGEKTKLALAQLVVGSHNLLLLDEPTNNLDPQAKEALLAALRHYEGTIVLVSHDTDFVAKLGPQRALLLPDGDTVYFDDELLELVALA